MTGRVERKELEACGLWGKGLSYLSDKKDAGERVSPWLVKQDCSLFFLNFGGNFN